MKPVVFLVQTNKKKENRKKKSPRSFKQKQMCILRKVLTSEESTSNVRKRRISKGSYVCRGTNRDEGELPSVELFGDLVKYNRFFFQLYDLKKKNKKK